MRLARVSPDAAVLTSSATLVSVAEPEAVGASFTEVTLVPSATVPVEYLVVPPVAPPALRSTEEALVIAVPELSIRWTERLPGVPFQSVAGLKRSSEALISRNAELLETAPRFVQVDRHWSNTASAPAPMSRRLR